MTEISNKTNESTDSEVIHDLAGSVTILDTNQEELSEHMVVPAKDLDVVLKTVTAEYEPRKTMVQSLLLNSSKNHVKSPLLSSKQSGRIVNKLSDKDMKHLLQNMDQKGKV